MDYEKLATYMHDEHGVLLFESEMNEVIIIVKEMIAPIYPHSAQEEADRLKKRFGSYSASIGFYDVYIWHKSNVGLDTTFDEEVLTILKGM